MGVNNCFIRGSVIRYPSFSLHRLAVLHPERLLSLSSLKTVFAFVTVTGSSSHVYHWLILPCLSLAHYLPPSPWFTPFATISNISISFQHPQTLCSQESFGILIETFCMREFCANRVSVVDGRTDTSELSFTVTSISQRMK